MSIVLAAVLVLTACGGGDEPADVPSPISTSPSATARPDPTSTDADDGLGSPTPTATGTTAADPVAQLPAIADTCTIDVATGEADRVRIAYPEGWLVQEACEWFDPEAESVEEGTEPSIAVSWRVSDLAFERAADVRDEMNDPIRYVGARSGYQALRIEGEASGVGLRQEGEPVVTWLIDLDPGTDEQGGTLIGTAHNDGGVPFAVAAYALGRMADTLLVEPPASERFVVTRLEGGSKPTTVTWVADEGCFRLRAGGPDADVVDEACSPSTAGSSGLRLVLLESDDGARRMLAGIASSPIQRITVPAASTLSGGTTQSTGRPPVRAPSTRATVRSDRTRLHRRGHHDPGLRRLTCPADPAFQVTRGGTRQPGVVQQPRR